MDWSVIVQSFPLFMQGLGLTVQLVVLSLAVGLVLAVVIGSVIAANVPLITPCLRLFVYVFRGSPLLIQIYLIYYGSGQFEWVRESWAWHFLREAYWCALLTFTLNTAAYTSEIIKGAILATPKADILAALAIGMRRWQVLAYVVLPSVWRRIIPAYGNEMIFMIHGSATAGVITLIDLFGAARIVNSRYFAPFESFIFIGLLYLLICMVCVLLVKAAERIWLKHIRL